MSDKLQAPEAPHVREDYCEVWQSGWRAGYQVGVASERAAREKQERIIELLKHERDSIPLCPDCRDKVRCEECLRCQIQRLTRKLEAERTTRAQEPQQWIEGLRDLRTHMGRQTWPEAATRIHRWLDALDAVIASQSPSVVRGAQPQEWEPALEPDGPLLREVPGVYRPKAAPSRPAGAAQESE